MIWRLNDYKNINLLLERVSTELGRVNKHITYHHGLGRIGVCWCAALISCDPHKSLDNVVREIRKITVRWQHWEQKPL